MKLLIHYNNATFDMGYVISLHTLPGMLLLTGIYVKPYQQKQPLEYQSHTSSDIATPMKTEYQ